MLASNWLFFFCLFCSNNLWQDNIFFLSHQSALWIQSQSGKMLNPPLWQLIYNVGKVFLARKIPKRGQVRRSCCLLHPYASSSSAYTGLPLWSTPTVERCVTEPCPSLALGLSSSPCTLASAACSQQRTNGLSKWLGPQELPSRSKLPYLVVQIPCQQWLDMVLYCRLYFNRWDKLEPLLDRKESWNATS